MARGKERVLVMEMGSRLNIMGGQQRIAAVLTNELKKYFDTSYLGFPTRYIEDPKGNILLSRKGTMRADVRASRVSEMWAFRFGYYLFVIRNLAGLGVKKEDVYEMVSKFNPHVIISNSIQDIAWLIYFKRKGMKFKSIYIDHATVAGDHIAGYFSKEGMPITVGTGLNAASMQGAKRKFFRFFDMSIALNRLALRQMRRYTDNVAYIPNGRDVKISGNKMAEGKLKRHLGIKKNDFVVLYIGRLFERQKNVSTLINAFRKIKDRNLKLLIVGDGPDESRYLDLANGDKRIIFTNDRKLGDSSRTYAIANLFVLPSVWEGFSLTVLEAAAYSIPMILSKDAYVEDLKIKEIGQIPTYDTFNVDDLSFLIKLMSSDRSLRAKASQASKNIAKYFTERKMVDSYRKIIKEIG